MERGGRAEAERPRAGSFRTNSKIALTPFKDPGGTGCRYDQVGGRRGRRLRAGEMRDEGGIIVCRAAGPRRDEGGIRCL